jgi:hypothetical protein
MRNASNNDSIRITTPGPGTRTVLTSFFVIGVAKGNTLLKKETTCCKDCIEGTLTLVVDPGEEPQEEDTHEGKHIIFSHTTEVKPPSGAAPAIEGKHYTIPPVRLPSGHPYLWALRFDGIPVGIYDLEVSIEGGQGDDATLTINQLSVLPPPAWDAPKKYRGPADISYPTPNQDISGEASDFSSYGTNNIAPTSAFLGSQAGSITWDGSENWVASFGAVIGSGELVLSISDNQPSSTSEYVTNNNGGGGGSGGIVP